MVMCSWPWGFWIRTEFHVCGIDPNLPAMWHWANYSTHGEAISSCVRRKWHPLQGEWQTQVILTPKAHAFNFDSTSSSRAVQVPWPFGGQLRRWQVIRIKLHMYEIHFKSLEFGLKYKIQCYLLWVGILFKIVLKAFGLFLDSIPISLQHKQ